MTWMLIQNVTISLARTRTLFLIQHWISLRGGGGGGGEEGSPKLTEKSIFHIRSIMSDYDLFDIHKLRNPGLRQFTWRRKTPLTMRRLDVFLISNILQSEVKSSD